MKKLPLPYSASPFEPKNSVGTRIDCSFVLCKIKHDDGYIFDYEYTIWREVREWNGIIELMCEVPSPINDKKLGKDYKILSAEWVKGTWFGQFDETKLKHIKCVGFERPCPEVTGMTFICFDNDERPKMNAEEFEKFKQDCIEELKKEDWIIL